MKKINLEKSKSVIKDTTNKIQSQLKKAPLPKLKKINKVSSDEINIELETEDKKPIVFSATKTSNSKPKTIAKASNEVIKEETEIKDNNNKIKWSFFRKVKKDGE